MVRLIARQRGGLAALKLTTLFGIDDFPAAKDSGKVLILIMYCYLITIIIIIIIIIMVIVIIIIIILLHSTNLWLWEIFRFSLNFFSSYISQLLKLSV